MQNLYDDNFTNLSVIHRLGPIIASMKLVSGSKGQKQLSERDVEPLVFNDLFDRAGGTLIRALTDLSMVQLITQAANSAENDSLLSTQQLLKDSIERLRGKAVNLRDESDTDSLLQKGLEFHTMTSLGKKRSSPTQGVISAMSAVPSGTDLMMQYVLLLDQQDRPTTGKFVLNLPGLASSQISLEAQLEAADTSISGLYVIHYVKNGKDYIGVQYWQNQQYPVADPVIEHPIQQGNNKNYHNIVVGLGRGTTVLRVHADADYKFTYRPNGQAYIPFKGHVNFGSNIKDITQPGNLDVKFYITTATGAVRPILNSNWQNRITVDSNDPTRLNWDWMDGNAAHFGSTNWGVDKAAYLHFEVGVKTQTSNNEFAYAQIHSLDKSFVPANQATTTARLQVTDSGMGKQDDVIDGIAYTYPVEHSWHCVASGTLVTLADGTSKTVDEVTSGDELRLDEQNNVMEVRSTIEQPIMDGETVYELVDSNNNRLLITGDHWIATPDGYKPVEELIAPDQIKTTTGIATITSLKPTNYEGQLFSLSLGDHEKRPTIGFEGTTYAANNILVGDNQLCRVHNMTRLNSYEHLSAGLPKEYKALADVLHVNAQA